MSTIQNQSQRILLVEDEVDLLSSLDDYLSLRGHTVDVAQDGQTGLNLALANSYDVVVLDIGLPRLDGLTVCAQIRRSTHASVGLIMLTARDTLQDKIDGLQTGADDYLVKPFALEELDMRIRALGRRTTLNRGTVLRWGGLSFDADNGQTVRDGQPLQLNRNSCKLLHCLMRHAPRAVSKADLEHALWGDEPPDSDALKVHMHALRRDLDKPFAQAMIETVRGQGYRLVE